MYWLLIMSCVCMVTLWLHLFPRHWRQPARGSQLKSNSLPLTTRIWRGKMRHWKVNGLWQLPLKSMNSDSILMWSLFYSTISPFYIQCLAVFSMYTVQYAPLYDTSVYAENSFLGYPLLLAHHGPTSKMYWGIYIVKWYTLWNWDSNVNNGLAELHA